MVALVEPFLTRLVSLWTTLQLGTLFRADEKTLSGRFDHLLRNMGQIVNRHDALHLVRRFGSMNGRVPLPAQSGTALNTGIL